MTGRHALLVPLLGMLLAAGARRSEAGTNVVRNSSFELDSRFNGGPMRQGTESYMTFVKTGDSRLWAELDNAEAWWVEGPGRNGVQVATGDAHSGRRSLLPQPGGRKSASAISAFDRTVGPRPITLSAWVKTEAAKGRIDLDLVSGWQEGARREAQVRGSVELPPSTAWRRLSVTVESPARLQAIARLRAEAGALWVDDVQIESGAGPSAFNVRPEEWLRLAFSGDDSAVLPKWIERRETTARLILRNDSRVPLAGTIVVRYGPWNEPQLHRLAESRAGDLALGSAMAAWTR